MPARVVVKTQQGPTPHCGEGPAALLDNAAASPRIPERAGPLVRSLGVPRSEPPCACSPGLADGQGCSSNIRRRAGDIGAALRVRISCKFAETEIVSMDSPSCSMMGR